MKTKAQELKSITLDFYSRYSGLDDQIASVNLSADKWSLKQIIGHLIDSASNNHQRFVRLQLADDVKFADYDKDQWLHVEKHNLVLFTDLFTLFLYLNRLLAHLIENMDPKVLAHKWIVNWDENTKFMTLESLIDHYIEHLMYHVRHFEERLEEVRKQNSQI